MFDITTPSAATPSATDAPELGGALDAIERALDTLSSTELLAWSSEDRRDALVRLARLATRLDAQRVRIVAVMDATGDAELDGAVNLRSWIHDRCRVSRAAAGRDLRAARGLRALPALAAAYADGNVGREQIDLTTRACTPEREGGFAHHDRLLADAASRFAPEHYRHVIGRVLDGVDPDGATHDAWARIERRRVHLASTLDGIGVLHGILDPESTEVVEAALDAHLQSDRDPADSPQRRTIAQRRADALVGVCRHYLRTAHRPPDTKRRRGRPHVSVVVDLEVLEGRGHVDLARTVRTEAARTGGLATETLLRLTCDAHVARVVTDGPSQPLDVGRATRTIPEAVWHALVARDRHCRHPECHASPAHCEAHHVVHWAHGGSTSLDNLVLLCWRHHRHHHEGRHRHRRPETLPTRAGVVPALAIAAANGP